MVGKKTDADLRRGGYDGVDVELRPICDGGWGGEYWGWRPEGKFKGGIFRSLRCREGEGKVGKFRLGGAYKGGLTKWTCEWLMAKDG